MLLLCDLAMCQPSQKATATLIAALLATTWSSATECLRISVTCPIQRRQTLRGLLSCLLVSGRLKAAVPFSRATVVRPVQRSLPLSSSLWAPLLWLPRLVFHMKAARSCGGPSTHDDAGLAPRSFTACRSAPSRFIFNAGIWATAFSRLLTSYPHHGHERHQGERPRLSRGRCLSAPDRRRLRTAYRTAYLAAQRNCHGAQDDPPHRLAPGSRPRLHVSWPASKMNDV
jgi:hypothetical protein